MLRSTVAVICLVLRVAHPSDVAPRIPCPTGVNSPGYACSADCSQLGYCDSSSNWLAIGECAIPGQICIGTACAFGTCPAPTDPDVNVICSDPDLKIPNLADSTCSSFYTCSVSANSPTGTGTIQRCSTGIFDPCSGQCITDNGSCQLQTDVQCSANTLDTWRRFSTNYRLAYICIQNGVRYDMLWTTCSDGYYLTGINGNFQCTPGSYGCTNGAVVGGDGTCRAPGRFPIAGTNCKFLECYADLTYREFYCASGYYYNTATKTCQLGICI